MIVARPNATILYATLAKGPKLPPEYQYNSTRHFMRELNRLGVTSACDAGGGFQNYPEDYEIIQQLHERGEMTLRIAYNLFTQKPGGELEDFARWSKIVKPDQGDDMLRCNGAGEMLVFSAADFEDFLEPRPDLPEKLEGELGRVVSFLAETVGPSACTRPTRSRSPDFSTFSKESTGMPRWTVCIGFSTIAKRFPIEILSESKHSAAALPFNIEWPFRANTSWIAMAQELLSAHPRSGEC